MKLSTDPADEGLCVAARVLHPVPEPPTPAPEGSCQSSWDSASCDMPPFLGGRLHEGSPGHGPSQAPAHPVKPSRVRLSWHLGTGWVGTCSGLSCSFSSYLSIPHLHAEFAVLTYCLPCDQTLLQNKRFRRIDSGPQPWPLGSSTAFHVPKSQSTLPFQSACGGRTASQLGRQLVQTDLSSPASWPPRALSFPSSREAISVSQPGVSAEPSEQRPSQPSLSEPPPPPSLSLRSIRWELLCAQVLGLEGGNGGGRKLSLESQSLGFESLLCHLSALELGELLSVSHPQFPQHLPPGAVEGMKGDRARVEQLSPHKGLGNRELCDKL